MFDNNEEYMGSIPSQGPCHTKDGIKMVPVVPLLSTEHSNLLQMCLQCYLLEIFLEAYFYLRMPFYYISRVWYELFEKQIKYYTLFSVLG